MFFECLNDAMNEGRVGEVSMAITQETIPWCCQRQIRMSVRLYPKSHF